MTTTLDLIRRSGRPDASQVRTIGLQQGRQLREFVERTADQRQAPQISFATVDTLAVKVPTGRYALPKVNPTEDNDVTFFEVREFRGGHRIQMLIGAPGQFRTQTLKLALQFYALTHLLEDLVAATALFGRKTETCGRCESPLTNKRSRERGLGDDCYRARMEGR